MKIGTTLAVLGFVIILLNATEYIGGFFGLSTEIKSTMIIGIALVIVGMVYNRKKED